MSKQRMAHYRPGGATGFAEPRTPPSRPPAGPAEATAPALAVVDLGKSFRSGFLRKRLRGVEGVSFSVRPGEVFALLGHNGAGKTTTINCILDLCHAETGEVRIFGVDHREARARARVGYLPERPYFFDHLTGRELLRFYARLLDLEPAGTPARIDRVLARVGMAERADTRLSRMSKGMLQRIGLAQAILGDADLLILDEPMSGLDPIGRREVRELLLELKAAGKTILLSSHIVPDVEMLADAIGILREGQLVRTCSRAEFAGEAAYLVNVTADDQEPSAWPAELRPARRSTAGDDLHIDAPDTARLREVLAECHAAGVTVRSVETHNSGLEEIFLAVHEQAEVVR